MKRFVLFAYLALFTLLCSLGVPATGAERPPILIGLDAQPVENFDKAVLVGNALHRYDSGPQKTTTLPAWLQASQSKKLYAIVQGLVVEGQNVDPTKFDNIVALSQDDEPDLNRYNPAKVNPNVFSPTDAPHPSAVGWTKPAVLDARYKSWKAKWPAIPVSVNFAGPQLLNQWYQPPLAWHKSYLGTSDEQGFDMYPKNVSNGQLYWPVYIFEKIKASGGNPVDVYVECSDQALDGDELAGKGRGPTAAEQGTLVWSALGHGAKRIWYFPQRIGSASKPTFRYYSVSADNEARAVQDYGAISNYMTLLGSGTRTLVSQTPKLQGDANKGAVVWPATETFKWELAGESLVVTVDYVGGTPPVLTYTAPTPPPPATQPATQPATRPSNGVKEIKVILDDGSTATYIRKD